MSITIIRDQDSSETRSETLMVSLLEPAPGQADDYWLSTAVDITLTIQTGICDRPPAVYEALVDRLRNINTGTLPPVSQCSDVVPEHLPLVTWINLSNQNITTFRDHDFEGLSGISVLTLDDNPITTLQDGLLDGLTDLRKIYISNAQIGTVTTDTFALNTQLSELWLYSSRLTEIDDGAFSNLVNLREMNLYNNKTGSFTAAKFQGLGNLHRLTLSNNNLRAVPADLLSNTPELRTLSLQLNKLRDLPDDFFAGMRHLTEVNLLQNTGNYVRTQPGSNRFNFPVNLERNQDGTVQARFPKGAPFPITVNLSVTNGSASPDALTIAAGSTTSNAATVTPANQAVNTVVSVSSAAFTSGADKGFTPVPGPDLTIPATEEPPQQDPPSKPTNLTGVVNGDGSITLRWEAPDDDSVTGYQILRRRPTEGEDTLLVYVEDTGSTATTYADTNVTAGVRHVYRVRAINAAGLSQWSNYARARP